MRKSILLSIAFILMSRVLYAQYNVSSDTTAIGLGATSIDAALKFNYQSHLIAHYGLGWYYDTDSPGAPMAYLGGYGGIKLFTGGMPRLAITNNGYFGIGTTTPRALFDVRSGSSPSGGDVPGVSVITGANQSVYQGTLSLESNSSVAADQGGTLVFKGIYTASYPAAYAAVGGFKENGTDGDYGGYLALYSRTNGGANSERLRITSLGNVGIGTSNPSQKLEVDGTSIASGAAQTNVGAYVGNGIRLTGSVANSAQDGIMYVSGGGGGAGIAFRRGSGYDTYLDFYINNTASSGAITEAMTIDNMGNLGIGTTSPLQKLHVNGVVRIDATGVSYNEGLSINVPPSMGGYGGITIHSTTPGAAYDASSIKWLLYHNYTPENNVGGGGFAIAQNNTDTRLYISNTGNISIGTIDSKGYKLAVAGDAIAESMTVKAYGDWPDYVFKTNHQLMPLSEVKTYIDKNQHLPDVPSADEIEKNGQNLGEMNKLLLKKVEELTLYLIDMKKENEVRDKSQQAEIDKLKKQIEILADKK